MRMKKFSFLILLFIIVINAEAQRLEASAPSQVSVGEQFRLTYTVNSQNVSSFRAGSIPEALEVLMGPSTSSQSSFQMVNGHTSSSSSITYTYILCANKNGSFVIPPAHINVGGRNVASSALRVRVSGRARQTANTGGADDSNQPHMRAAGSRISSNDLFIKVNANKKRVHEQEPVLLTYKVYTQVDLTQLEGKMPDLQGFHNQEVPLPQQKTFHTETVNGRPYRCVTWSQYVMYPQMTGSLTIPAITFKGIVVQQNRNVDPMEAFFNGGSGYVEVKRNITAPKMTIVVDPLPAKPAGFSGGVGRFNISASLSKKEVKEGEPIPLRVVVGGNGNLKLIKQPVVNFPKNFDKYDAKVSDKTRLTANGVEGNMVYDFMAVPRNQGQYTIPSVEFNYYDVNSNSYRTIRTQSFNVTVAKGDGKSSSTDFSEKNQDIHHIKEGEGEQHQMGDFFFGSLGYWICLLLPFCAFVALLIIFRQRAIENSDMVRMRSNRANKIATKRLKKANMLMLAGKQSEFYDEVMRALWGYVSDKLNMPVEELSRENIQENFINHHIDQATIDKFVSALDECEFERYA